MEALAEIKKLALAGGKALLLRHLCGFTINFLGSVALARILGPDVLGLYFVSFTVLTVIRQLIDFGVGTHLIRLPAEPTSKDLSVAFTLQQAIGGAALLLVVTVVTPASAVWYGRSDLLLLVASAGLGGYFQSWQGVRLAMLERGLSYYKVGIVEIAEIAAFNAVAVLGAVLGWGMIGLALGNVLRGLVPAVTVWLLTRIRLALLQEWSEVISLARDVLPIVGANLIVWFIMMAPPLLVGSLAGLEAFGIAQMAYTVLGNTMVIATIFQRVSLTAFARLQKDFVIFNEVVQQALQLLSFVYIPVTMGIAALSPAWVPVVYGTGWEGMPLVMLIAAIPLVLTALFSILHSALLATGLASLVFKQNFLHAILYWSIMAFLAASYGPLAVPISQLIAMSAGYLFVVGYQRSIGRLHYKPLAFRVLGGTAVMILAWIESSREAVFTATLLWMVFIVLTTPSVRYSITAYRSMREGLK